MHMDLDPNFLLEEVFGEGLQNETVRVAVVQLSMPETHLQFPGRKITDKQHAEIQRRISRTLEEVRKYKINAIVFPECTIPSSLLEEIAVWAKKNNCIVIAGSHYKIFGNDYVSTCPVIMNDGNIYYTEKTTISPLEKNASGKNRVIPGMTRFLFRETMIGSFMVLICSDCLDANTTAQIDTLNIDILIVTACHKGSARHYFPNLSILCRESTDGLYALYSNSKSKGISDGFSAIFGSVDRAYLSNFKEAGETDLNPEEKLWVAKSDNDFAIVDFDILTKKPSLPKAISSNSNVNIVTTRSRLKSVGASLASHRKQYKLVAFDMDGTLIRGLKFSWVQLWELCGDDGTLWRTYLKNYIDNKISYEDWCLKAVSYFADAGLSKELIFDIANTSGKIVRNFEEGMTRLKYSGIRVALISGGVDVFLKALIPHYNIVFDDIFINKLHFDVDDIVSGVKPTAYDYEGKAVAIEELCQKYGIDSDEVIFVGDTFNDQAAIKKAGYSIIFRDGETETAYSANKSIYSDDMNELIDHIMDITEISDA